MSAYLKELVTRCYREDCKSRAVVEVFNTWNASQGVFCRPCGKALVARLKRGEQDMNVTAGRAFLDDDADGDF